MLKTNVSFRIWVVVVLMSLQTITVYSQIEDIGVDFVEASPMLSIDLDRLPADRLKIAIGLLPTAVQGLTDQALSRRFDLVLQSYLRKVRTSLNGEQGQLILVRMYSDEFRSYLPANFFIPLATGTDPVDAYSQFINTPSLIPAPEDIAARDASYYLWISKNASTKSLSVSQIPRELKTRLERDGSKAAVVKVKTGRFAVRPRPTAANTFQREVDFWNGQVRQLEATSREAARLEQMKSLYTRLGALQANYVSAIQEYEELMLREKSNDSFLQTLSAALKVAEFFFGENSPVPSDRSKMSVDTEVISNQNRIIKDKRENAKKRMNQINREIEDVLSQLKRVGPLA